MMGREAPLQRKLFYTNFNLERHIRGNHPLRHIAQRIDFEFAYQEVADTYGEDSATVDAMTWCNRRIEELKVP